METATLKQAGKVLELIAQSERSGEWIQNHLIGSGALSDLLAVDNLAGISRDARRRVLGLSALNPSLLEEIGIVTIPATVEAFVAREKFVVGSAKAKISWIGSNFEAWFLGRTEEPSVETTLCYAKLVKSSVDGPILVELGDKAETALAQIWALMDLQPNGEEGVLLINGWANIFYALDANGELRAVHVYWLEGGWLVHAGPVSSPYRWSGEHRVFSRNS
ncbi:MAG: hypothetical protein Q7S62_00270 [bacterium]|nr:hypothetical protein [bacterium]